MKEESKIDYAKVFGLYLGQDVEYLDYWDHSRKAGTMLSVGQGHCFVPGNNNGQNLEHCKLILRTLDQITDEEAREVAQLVNPGPDSWSSVYRFKYEVVLESGTCLVAIGITKIGYEIRAEIEGDEWFVQNQFQITDYLRSRGFDLPCYYLGGKTLIESGLAVRKEVSNG